MPDGFYGQPLERVGQRDRRRMEGSMEMSIGYISDGSWSLIDKTQGSKGLL